MGAKTRFAGCKYRSWRVQTRSVAGAKTRAFEPQKLDASKIRQPQHLREKLLCARCSIRRGESIAVKLSTLNCVVVALSWGGRFGGGFPYFIGLY
jgi:hypothetical protein